MPQLMPLFWLSYMFTFFLLVIMMKSVYSMYDLNYFAVTKEMVKSPNELWLW